MIIDDNTAYVLIPVYEEGSPLKTKGMFGKDLKAAIDEDTLLDALNNGKTLMYKGNEYYLDERI